MKIKSIISKIKRCIKCIESSKFDKSSLSNSIWEIRRFLYSLGLNNQANNLKGITHSIWSNRYSSRSLVSRLETVMRDLQKIDSLSDGKNSTGKKCWGKDHCSRMAKNLSRFDVILAKDGENYSYCVISGIIPNDHVTAYPIVMDESEVNPKERSCRISGEGAFHKAFLTSRKIVVPYKSAQNCYYGKLPITSDLEAALKHVS